jgi:BirA family biotin operon repressor/biotin-[acetyl-CoA-carboxylase] ligase
VIDPSHGPANAETARAAAAPIEAWPDRLDAACRGLRFLHRAVVVRETGSTQDLARGRAAGDVVVAWRQTTGRGRDGRTWADTGLDGVAVTAVAAVQGPWIALAAGVAAAEAIERVAPSITVGLKWPNDLMLGDRKVGGVLIEHDGDASLIGIGINVSQGAFEPQLAARATSLALDGAPVDRIAILEALLPALDHQLGSGVSAAIEAFRRRDMLRGRVVRIRAAAGSVVAVAEGGAAAVAEGRSEAVVDGSVGTVVEGVVESIDPLVSIRIRTASGVREIDASGARIESFA